MAEPSTSTEMVRVPILGENGRISDDYIPESIPQAVTAAEQAAESAASSANQALQQAAAAEKAASSATGSVEQAKTYANNASTYMSTAESHAESAAVDAQAASVSASAAATSAAAAEVSNQSAAQSSADAMGFRNSAVQYRDQAREAAQEAQGYVTTVQQLEQNATNSATAAQNSATSASASAETATTAASQASTSATNAAASAQTASEKAASVLDHYIESATATTLEPGQQATATVADKVLQLGIPKGDKGDPGDVSAVQIAEGSDLSVSTDGGTVTIDDSALRARIAELENQAANVVTGTSTGIVAHGEDAYAQKPREVRIKGRTVQNLWVNPRGSSNGVTVTSNSDGSLTFAGTSTNNTSIRTEAYYTIARGKTYTLSVDKDIQANVLISVLIRRTDGTSISQQYLSSSNKSRTFTVDDFADFSHIQFDVNVNTAGTTVSGTYRVMLNEGSTAQPWCPPGLNSVDELSIVTAGKNLVSFPEELTVGVYTFRCDSDGYITADNHQLDDRQWTNFSRANASVTLPPGSYAISADVRDAVVDAAGKTPGIRVFSEYSDDLTNGSFKITNAGIQHKTFTLDRVSTVGITAKVYEGSARIWLELGSTATAYEPPNVTTTPLPEVELRSLPNGTCDELVIKADGTCEVERRTGYIASYTDEEVTGEYVSTGNGLEAGASIVYELDEPTAEPQSPVTLPALPAPTFNQYHDADIPSDTSTEYARDINLVLANLESVQAALLGGE